MTDDEFRIDDDNVDMSMRVEGEMAIGLDEMGIFVETVGSVPLQDGRTVDMRSTCRVSPRMAREMARNLLLLADMTEGSE